MQLRKGKSTKENKSQRSIDNSAKTLLANIRFMSVDDPVRTVVITSTIPNEGKTYIASNLARAMATSGVRTLLVECDLRRRSLARDLNIHTQHGIYSVLSGDVALSEAAVQTSTPRMYFLDAEPHIPNPSDLLSSRRFSNLIEAAKREFGYIVFDTPPVGTFIDSAVLGAKVDAVFLIVRESYTRREEVARAAEQLRTANAPLAGIVMNFCEGHSSEYYYDYYYREDRSSSTSANAPMSTFSSSNVDVEFQSSSAKHSSSGDQRNWSNAPDLNEESK